MGKVRNVWMVLGLLSISGPSLMGQEDVSAGSRKPGDTIRVFEMNFAWIPPGHFQMGSRLTPEAVQDRYGFDFTESAAMGWSNQLPKSRVSIDQGFWMAQHEVTVGLFQKFRSATGYKTDGEREGWSFGHGPEGFGRLEGANWQTPGWELAPEQPVCAVSWSDAQIFLMWLSNKVEGSFRLPTEAEWEYAARAGTDTNFFWGDDPQEAATYANVLDAYFKIDDGYKFVAPVGSFQPNPWGLYDMVGNVWEWCETLYRPSYAPDAAITNERVDRGGGWDSPPYNARLANRGAATEGFRSVNLGLRLVYVPPSKEQH